MVHNYFASYKTTWYVTEFVCMVHNLFVWYRTYSYGTKLLCMVHKAFFPSWQIFAEHHSIILNKAQEKIIPKT